MKTELITIKESDELKWGGLFKSRDGTAVIAAMESRAEAFVVHYGGHFNQELNFGEMVILQEDFRSYWKRLPAGSQVLLTQE